MFKNIFILMFCIALIGCSSDSAENKTSLQPNDSPVLTDSEKDAFEVLFNSGEFASTAVGYAGSTPRQVPAFQVLLKSEHAVDLFCDLQEDATLAGQLYGLCGLYLTDKVHFDEVISTYQNNPAKVQTFFGCELGNTPLSDLIPMIEDGTWPNAYKNCNR